LANKVKPGGSGMSNDGNTARRFSEKLNIERFNVIKRHG
jgi:hypothetical protein